MIETSIPPIKNNDNENTDVDESALSYVIKENSTSNKQTSETVLVKNNKNVSSLQNPYNDANRFTRGSIDHTLLKKGKFRLSIQEILGDRDHKKYYFRFHNKYRRIKLVFNIIFFFIFIFLLLYFSAIIFYTNHILVPPFTPKLTFLSFDLIEQLFEPSLNKATYENNNDSTKYKTALVGPKRFPFSILFGISNPSKLSFFVNPLEVSVYYRSYESSNEEIKKIKEEKLLLNLENLQTFFIPSDKISTRFRVTGNIASNNFYVLDNFYKKKKENKKIEEIEILLKIKMNFEFFHFIFLTNKEMEETFKFSFYIEERNSLTKFQIENFKGKIYNIQKTKDQSLLKNRIKPKEKKTKNEGIYILNYSLLGSIFKGSIRPGINFDLKCKNGNREVIWKITILHIYLDGKNLIIKFISEEEIKMSENKIKIEEFENLHKICEVLEIDNFECEDDEKSFYCKFFYLLGGLEFKSEDFVLNKRN